MKTFDEIVRDSGDPTTEHILIQAIIALSTIQPKYSAMTFDEIYKELAIRAKQR